nr:MAG TPA: hypothetical protein [Bacteriophage sp.]
MVRRCTNYIERYSSATKVGFNKSVWFGLG